MYMFYLVKIVLFQAPDGRYLRPDITDNKDATVTVHYTPEDVGKYNAKIKYGGDPIPGSTFEVNTRPSGDASKCQITGRSMKFRNFESSLSNLQRSTVKYINTEVITQRMMIC